MIETTAIPDAFTTVYLNLFLEREIKTGNTLLMNTGTSGIARVIIPLAKAFGIRVITKVVSNKFDESTKYLNADIVTMIANEKYLKQ